MGDAETVAVVVNPVRPGARAALAAIRSACGGSLLRVAATTADDGGEAAARSAVASGAGTIVAVGGDGTVRTVAGVVAGTSAALGIVPTGTANLCARNLHLPLRDVRAAMRVAVGGVRRDIDLGRARVAGREHPFLVMAGIGHDSLAVAAAEASPGKGLIGWAEYLARGAARMTRRRHPFLVRVDGGPWRGLELWSVLVGNAPRVVGGVAVFPGEGLASGHLTALLVEAGTPLAWWRVGLRVVTGRPLGGLERHRARAGSVRPLVPLPLQVDGDVVAEVSRVDFRVEPRAVTVRGPRQNSG